MWKHIENLWLEKKCSHFCWTMTEIMGEPLDDPPTVSVQFGLLFSQVVKYNPEFEKKVRVSSIVACRILCILTMLIAEVCSNFSNLKR